MAVCSHTVSYAAIVISQFIMISIIIVIILYGPACLVVFNLVAEWWASGLGAILKQVECVSKPLWLPSDHDIEINQWGIN